MSSIFFYKYVFYRFVYIHNSINFLSYPQMPSSSLILIFFHSKSEEGELHFGGWSRMSQPIESFNVVEVSVHSENIPSQVPSPVPS